MKEKLVSKEEIRLWVPEFNTPVGKIVLDWGMSLFGLNKTNGIYDRCKQCEGVEFCKCVLDDIGVKIVAENTEILDRFAKKPFITVANHPYGHIDALGVISIIGSVRSDYKVTANFILSLIDTLADHFINVNPYGKEGVPWATGPDSVRNILSYLEEGHPLGFFPAGKVSLPYRKGLKYAVKDGPWKPSTVKVIRRAKVPVIPIWISGQNSWIFNLLSAISWKVRSIRLPHELTNKRGRTVRIKFGEPVMPEELEPITSGRQLADLLEERVYALADKR